MITNSKKCLILLAMVLIVSMVIAGCGETQSAGEQEKIEYPQKEVTFICPWPAGGGSDLIVRSMANTLADYFPEPFVPVNREGANGIVATSELANAKPDGYTISLGATGVFTTSPLTQEGVTYKMDDFDFLIGLTNEPIVLSLPADSPYKTLEELFKASKEKNFAIRYANSGQGGVPQVTMAYLFNLAEAKTQSIPYSGGPAAITAALGGTANCDVVSSHIADVLEHAKAGTLRPIAISSSERAALLPDMPTLKELGYDVDMGVRKFIVAPKGMPEDVKSTLVDALTKAANEPKFKEAMESGGLIYDVMTGQEVEDYLNEQYPIMKEIIENTPTTKK